MRLDAQRGLEDTDRIRQLFDLGVQVTISTDDPAEFASGFLSDLLTDLQKASGYTDADLVRFMESAFEASWLPEDQKTAHIRALHNYALTHGVQITGGTR